jgi:hypothetical protein
VDFDQAAPILQAAGLAEAADEPLTLDSLADELAATADQLATRLEDLEGWGLLLSAAVDSPAPRLTRAGRQYLARRGEVARDVLAYLGPLVDDLHAREALLRGGTVLVADFRAALHDGDAVEHARALVPAAFAPALDDGLAIDLFAAAVALVTRLTRDAPAGCVAEEIMGVALLDEARTWLADEHVAGRLSADEEQAAADALSGVFELFGDADVLLLFDLTDPADAALAGHSPEHVLGGVVDQRLEAWFDPFAWTIATGHLAAPPKPT